MKLRTWERLCSQNHGTGGQIDVVRVSQPGDGGLFLEMGPKDPDNAEGFETYKGCEISLDRFEVAKLKNLLNSIETADVPPPESASFVFNDGKDE